MFGGWSLNVNSFCARKCCASSIKLINVRFHLTAVESPFTISRDDATFPMRRHVSLYVYLYVLVAAWRVIAQSQTVHRA